MPLSVLVELQTLFDFEPFTTVHHRLAVQELIETAMQVSRSEAERIERRGILKVNSSEGYGNCGACFQT